MEGVFAAAPSVAVFVYLAFALQLLGFLARDELLLRFLMLSGSGFYLLYYYTVAESPLWDPFLTNAALGLANLAMIGVVMRERSTLGMGAATVTLYRQFPLLSPGQFRRLIRVGRIEVASGATELVREGARPDELYYVVSGTVWIEKSGQTAQIEAGSFVGEIAYFAGGAATATVVLADGARYVKWPHDQLDLLFRRSPSLRVALLGHLNSDLCRKLSRSMPVAQAV